MASATRTRTPTETPPSGLGTRRFSLNPDFSVVENVLPGGKSLVRSGFEGYLELTAGEPDAATGRAVIAVTGASEYLALGDVFGAICIRPLVPALNAGLIDCDGDAEFGRVATQNHRLGEVGVGSFTESDCINAGGTVEMDGAPHEGVCNGPILVEVFENVDAGPGAVIIGPAAPLGIEGLPVEVGFEAALPCGDEGPGALQSFALISAPLQTRIENLNSMLGQTLTYADGGESFSCATWTQEDGPGRLRLAVPSVHGAGVSDVITVFVFDD